MSVPNGPNPLRVAWSVLRSRRVRQPAPSGSASVDHDAFGPILEQLRRQGVPGLVPIRPELIAYIDTLTAIDPDALTHDEALAYWLNLYNAGALDASARAAERSAASILRLPGAFDRPWTTVAGEALSLDDIEHGKVRRFRDPRIHAALVCGSASCPTLRYEPFVGSSLDDQLEQQMRSFLDRGGVVADRSENVLRLSRIFLWYGSDFVRPERMPGSLPARKRSVAASLRPWLDDDTVRWIDASEPQVEIQTYDWTLACSIG